ncbi:hypothetical protein [Peribacillus asahii]|uniref:hypothetical protein n=1 Tax=Peribacillus asahii TaxID=228899 RepID=UPI0037F8E8DD
MKQRLLLCLLLCGVMLYYAVPRLSLQAGGAESLFAASWLLFALCTIAGNLTALLYSPKGRRKPIKKKEYKKMHHYS